MLDTLAPTLEALAILRHALPGLTIPQTILTLEAIIAPGITLPELAEVTGYAQNTISRNVRQLEAEGLLYTTRPATQPHRLSVHLTARGALLESRLRQVVEEGSEAPPAVRPEVSFII